MRWFRPSLLVVFCGVAGLAPAQCLQGHDHRASKNGGWLVTDFKITGTQTLSSGDLATLTSLLTGSCFNESSEELQQRILGLFQERGYFAAKINQMEIERGDPLGQPQPVAVEAEVLEGPRYKLASIQFTGNHAFGDARLRRAFSFKKGDVFQRSKIATGLDGLRVLYESAGFLDFFAVPETQVTDPTVVLHVELTEGTQYHMGALEILAKKELADKLRAQWRLAEGAVFDYSYTAEFVRGNQALLPGGFSQNRVRLVRDCPSATVRVRLLVDATILGAQPEAKDVECERGGSRSD